MKGAQHAVPVLRRCLALADRDDASQTRFGVEHPVVVARRLLPLHEVTVRHLTQLGVVEQGVVHRLDEPRSTVGERRVAVPHHDEAGGEPRRIDEGQEVAGALERGGVVVVEEEATMPLESIEGVEELSDAGHRSGVVEIAQLVGAGDREHAQADVGHVRVVTHPSFRDAARRWIEVHVVDRQPVLTVVERLEPAPGISRHPARKLLGVGGERGAIDMERTRPAVHPRAHERSRRDLAAPLGFPRLLAWRLDRLEQRRLGVAPLDVVSQLAGVRRRRAHPSSRRIPASRPSRPAAGWPTRSARTAMASSWRADVWALRGRVKAKRRAVRTTPAHPNRRRDSSRRIASSSASLSARRAFLRSTWGLLG